MKTPEISTTELYRTICLSPFGEQILIHRDTGEISTIDSSLILGDSGDWILFGKTEGDFPHDQWGVVRVDDDSGVFAVNGIDGRFESADAALEAAINEFGIPAEIHDELIGKLHAAMDAENAQQ